MPILDVMAKIRAAAKEPGDDTQKVESGQAKEGADKPLAPTDEAPEVPAAVAKPSLADRLAERLAARKEKTEGKNQYFALKQQVEQQQHELNERYRAAQQDLEQKHQAFEAERRQWLSDISSNPIKLVTDAGHTPEDIMRNIQLSDDPQWQVTQKMQRQVADLNAKLEQEQRARAQYMQTEQQRQQEAQAQYHARAHNEAVNTLLTNFASPDKAPALHRLYDPEEIVERVQRLAVDYQKRTGEVAPLDELAEYAEQQAMKRLHGPGMEAAGAPVKAKGNGPRTLSAAAASERRATPRSVKDMTAEEHDAHIVGQMQKVRAGR
jgi:hypothetical protein